jgi:creatinine amidohydrolase
VSTSCQVARMELHGVPVGHGCNVPASKLPLQKRMQLLTVSTACPFRLRQTQLVGMPGCCRWCRSLFPTGDGSHATASESGRDLLCLSRRVKTATSKVYALCN